MAPKVKERRPHFLRGIMAKNVPLFGVVVQTQAILFMSMDVNIAFAWCRRESFTGGAAFSRRQLLSIFKCYATTFVNMKFHPNYLLLIRSRLL